MKRILILTDGFAAPAYVPRVRFLINYLQEHGYAVEVLTEFIAEDEQQPSIGCPVHELHYYKCTGKLGTLEWGLKFAIRLFTPQKDHRLAAMGKHLMKINSYDLIFCSCFNTFPLCAAKKLAHQFKVPLVVDLRDIEEQCPGTGYYAHHLPKFGGLSPWLTSLYKRINITRRNGVLTAANAVTSVSEWHVNYLKQFNRNTYLIYNGYDATLFTPKNVKSDAFYITYTGRLYEKVMQDPTLFFDGIAHLLNSKTIDRQKVVLQFYTNDASKAKLKSYTSVRGLDDICQFYNYVPTEQIPDILHQSSLLLVFSNKADKNGANGIMTTKLYEAMGVEKPVLCVKSDEALLEKLITDTHCGVSARTQEEVETFILAQYSQWKRDGFTRVNESGLYAFEYSRQHQSKKFVDIFEHLLS